MARRAERSAFHDIFCMQPGSPPRFKHRKNSKSKSSVQKTLCNQQTWLHFSVSPRKSAFLRAYLTGPLTSATGFTSLGFIETQVNSLTLSIRTGCRPAKRSEKVLHTHTKRVQQYSVPGNRVFSPRKYRRTSGFRWSNQRLRLVIR